MSLMRVAFGLVLIAALTGCGDDGVLDLLPPRHGGASDATISEAAVDQRRVRHATAVAVSISPTIPRAAAAARPGAPTTNIAARGSALASPDMRSATARAWTSCPIPRTAADAATPRAAQESVARTGRV
jgi:hypothetical protein